MCSQPGAVLVGFGLLLIVPDGIMFTYPVSPHVFTVVLCKKNKTNEQNIEELHAVRHSGMSRRNSGALKLPNCQHLAVDCENPHLAVVTAKCENRCKVHR